MGLPGVRGGGGTHKPAPFQRPGITLSAGPVRRWIKADPRQVAVGDIIRGAGRVVDITYKSVTGGGQNEAYAVFQVLNGSSHRVDIGDTVVVFSHGEGEPVG